ncbi:MAG: hypothetical protein JWP88_557 [Flaviaesturariibacter sp.]|nr:hypothetical protein [Flaviaesturariibacter sp.]
MEKDEKNKDAAWQRIQPTYVNEPDQTPRREGGDDALAEVTPTDPAADEKVIANNPQPSRLTAADKAKKGEA